MSLHGKFVKHVSYPIISRIYKQSGILDNLYQLYKTQYYSKQQIEDIQLIKLKKILIHAYKNTNFYRDRFNDAQFNPTRFSSFDELRKIPPLTKSDLRHNLPSLVAKNISPQHIHLDATGGSTADRTSFYRDNHCLLIKKGFEYRFNTWAGWDIGEKIAFYWPAIQDFSKKRSWKMSIKNQLSDRYLMLYSGQQNEEILERHYSKLNSFRPALLRAFPNPLSILAKYIQSKGKRKIFIPSIISVGEPLLSSQRKLFNEVFGAKVMNCYVSREIGNMACECGARPGFLHVNSEMIHIEPLSDVSNSNVVKLLITDFTNYGMPFIRYQIEDLGIFSNDSCDCCRGLHMLHMEAGRVSDFLISPHDKSRISGAGLLHHLIAEGPDVGQIQIVQDKIDHIVLKIVKGENFHPDMLKHYDQVIQRVFKGQMTYKTDFVSNIEREKSKKYFFTKCLVSDDDI